MRPRIDIIEALRWRFLGGAMPLTHILVRLLVPLTSLCLAFTTVQAAEPSMGAVAVLAGSCVNCHGPQGGPSTSIPNIRGLDQQYLLARLMAFRDGNATAATIMPRLMKGYDPDQISALAKWFARGGKE
jgi:cytochrome subunit of sulfide dehydrogenase